MVSPTKRYSELIADLNAQCSRLCKAQVMRVARMTTANETWLRGNKTQMCFIAAPLWLSQGKGAFVDFAGGGSRSVRSVELLAVGCSSD